jgi:hypothetical protein
VDDPAAMSKARSAPLGPPQVGGAPQSPLEHYLMRQNRHLQAVIAELERRCARLQMELQMLLPSGRTFTSDD